MPTSYSTVATFTGNGATTVFAIPFAYLSTQDVMAEVNGAVQTFSVAGAFVTFNAAPANGSTIRIFRRSGTRGKLVDYIDGAVLTERDLDLDSTQAFYMGQEAFDQARSLDADVVAAKAAAAAAAISASNASASQTNSAIYANAAQTSANTALTAAAAVGVTPTTVGDGVTDDWAAINNALTYLKSLPTGGTLNLPAGRFKVSAGFDFGTTQNIYIRGAGSNATVIEPTAGVTTLFIMGHTGGSANLGIRDLHINCTNATACTAIEARNVNGFWLDRVSITLADIGILITGGVIQYYLNFQVNRSKTAGIKVVGGNDQFLINGVLSNAGYSEPSVAGIWITKNDAIWIDNVDCITQKHGLYMAPQGTDTVCWGFVLNSAFDTGTGSGIVFAPAAGALIKGMDFTGCWTATNDYGVYSTGSGTVDGISFVNHRSFNNNKSGYYLENGQSKNFVFVGCKASGNSASPVTTYSGFDIGANVSGFQIIGCRSGQMAAFGGTQNRGILVNPGTSANYTIIGNDLRLNSQALYDAGTGYKIVKDNMGASDACRAADSQSETSTASANNLTLPYDANYFPITGTTQINLIDNTSWQGGSRITLKFASALTVKHNQAASGNNKPIMLAAGVDLAAGAGTTLTLRYDSADAKWYQ